MSNSPQRSAIFTPKTRKRLVLNDTETSTTTDQKGNSTPNFNKRRLSIPSDSDESDIDDDLHFAVQNQLPEYARETSTEPTTSPGPGPVSPDGIQNNNNNNFNTQVSSSMNSNTDQLEWDHSATNKPHTNLYGGGHSNSQYQGFE